MSNRQKRNREESKSCTEIIPAVAQAAYLMPYPEVFVYAIMRGETHTSKFYGLFHDISVSEADARCIDRIYQEFHHAAPKYFPFKTRLAIDDPWWDKASALRETGKHQVFEILYFRFVQITAKRISKFVSTRLMKKQQRSDFERLKPKLLQHPGTFIVEVVNIDDDNCDESDFIMEKG